MPEEPVRPLVVCRVLGALALRADGGEFVELNAEKQRRLLAELVLRRGTWVETDTLIEALWDDANRPASARNNLKTYVHQLRQLLPATADGSARLLSRRGGYLLSMERAELDATAFEDLAAEGRAALGRGDTEEAVEAHRAALALWHGEPFTQVATQRAEQEAERLHELRSATVEWLTEALLAGGRPAEAAAVVRPLTVREPTRETGWRLLVTALHAQGRPADALSAYQDARRTLVEELGAEPGQELRALHRKLLDETQADTEPAPLHQPPAPAVRRAPVGRARQVPRMVIAGVVVVVVIAVAGFLVNRSFDGSPTGGTQQTAAAELRGYSAAVGLRREVPGYPTDSGARPKLLFGVGEDASTAAEDKLVVDSPVHMLTTFYDAQDDLVRFNAWRTSLIPSLYHSGKALHLVVVPPESERKSTVRTRYGPGCGQPYPLGDRFLEDVRSLAKDFAGRRDGPPLYVSVFNGLQKLACSLDGYDAGALNRNYYRAIKDRYLDVLKIFHANAPNARVALNWDGWQVDTDRNTSGDPTATLDHFADELRQSDFTSFSAFESTNAEPIRHTVHELGKYGPVMLSYFQPYNHGKTGEPALRSYDADLASVFTPQSIRALTSEGLFAWSFWNSQQATSTEKRYEHTRDLIRRYAGPAGTG